MLSVASVGAVGTGAVVVVGTVVVAVNYAAVVALVVVVVFGAVFYVRCVPKQIERVPTPLFVSCIFRDRSR